MKEFFKNVSWVREIACLTIGGAIFALIYFLALPAFTGWGFLWTLLASLGISAIIDAVWTVTTNTWEDEEENTIYGWIAGGLSIILILAMIVIRLGGSSMFHAKAYANSFTPIEVQTQSEDIPSIDDVAKVSLMDTATATKLGDRTLGALSKYVSQYNVAAEYTTISYQGKVVKVAPLVHSGFFKAMKNNTIPGYVIVDTLTSEAKFVEVEGGIKYSPSAYFSKDLLRHIRSEYKSEKLGSYYNFQLDENGTPYWVVAVIEYNTWMGAKVPVGAITVNAVNGDMAKYALNDIPEWVEQVFDGDMVCDLYNRHGYYINGFWNFSDTGRTQVTEDYGYLERNGDIYIYTGVTSVAADESNIGFIMVNSRTGECNYYPVAGAEEYSAMSAAEGVVQNYGYTASFPSLVMYGEDPTYVMVLKDSNGLVKKYAMVNMVNYTVVAVEDTLDATKEAYIKAMKKSASSEPVKGESETLTITVASIDYITVAGETFVYVKDTEGRCFKQAFAENESLILLEVGQQVEVEVNGIVDITPAKFK